MGQLSGANVELARSIKLKYCKRKNPNLIQYKISVKTQISFNIYAL